MEAFTLARVIHILAIVLWIGGVAMVTTVIIPSIRAMRSKEEQRDAFKRIEHRFAKQARITTLLTALSGFYMLYELDAWDRYLDGRFWWVHAMTFVWLLFTVILYVLEPLFLDKLFEKYVKIAPKKTFTIVQRAHWVLLLISLLTIAASVAGSHGWFWV